MMALKVDNGSLMNFRFIEVEGKTIFLSFEYKVWSICNNTSHLYSLVVYVCFGSKESVLEKLYIIDLEVCLQI